MLSYVGIVLLGEGGGLIIQKMAAFVGRDSGEHGKTQQNRTQPKFLERTKPNPRQVNQKKPTITQHGTAQR